MPGRRRHRHRQQGRQIFHRYGRQLQRALHLRALFADGGILETNTFTLQGHAGRAAKPRRRPPLSAETPNNVNPQDLVAQINKLSNLVYAVFGPSSPGQPPAYIPIQAVGAGAGCRRSADHPGTPGFNGYSLNVLGAGKQPVLISQIYSGNLAYPIAGSTTIQPFDPKKQKAVPFYGSLSHGLGQAGDLRVLQSADKSSYPAAHDHAADRHRRHLRRQRAGRADRHAVQLRVPGLGRDPAADRRAIRPPARTMKADDSVFYTFNAVTNSVMDSTGKSATARRRPIFRRHHRSRQSDLGGGRPLPKFTLNGNSYAVNLSTTLTDGVTSRYTLVAGGKSYLFDPGNTQVTGRPHALHLQPAAGRHLHRDLRLAGRAGGHRGAIADHAHAVLDDRRRSARGRPGDHRRRVQQCPATLNAIVLGVSGPAVQLRSVHGHGHGDRRATQTTVPIQTGLTFASNSGYGYVIGFVEQAYYRPTAARCSRTPPRPPAAQRAIR